MKTKKKYVLIILSLILSISLASCGEKENENNNELEVDNSKNQILSDENIIKEDIENSYNQDKKENNEDIDENENLIKKEDLEKRSEDRKYKVSALFDEVYYELINDKTINEDKLLSFINNVNFNVEKMVGMPGDVEYIFTSDQYPDEYCYIQFSSEDTNPYNILHYENQNIDKAVSWMNLNEERLDEFEKYQVYDGELFFEVNNISDQIEFLNKKN